MSRRPNAIPSIKLTLMLPSDIHELLTSSVYSELEERVPVGAYQSFFIARIREYFKQEHLDLAAYIGSSPGAWVISGTPEAIAAVKAKL